MRLYCFSFRSIPGYAELDDAEQREFVRLAQRRMLRSGSLLVLCALMAAANVAAAVALIEVLGATSPTVWAVSLLGTLAGVLAIQHEIGVTVERLLLLDRRESPPSPAP